MQASYPDGSQAEMLHLMKDEVLQGAAAALANGAEKVVIFPDPHPFQGSLRRCGTCGHQAHDPIHCK